MQKIQNKVVANSFSNYRAKTGEIKLYCKGADNILMSRLKLQSSLNDSLKLKTTQHLVEYANKGLRTLVVAYRKIDINEYQVSFEK